MSSVSPSLPMICPISTKCALHSSGSISFLMSSVAGPLSTTMTNRSPSWRYSSRAAGALVTPLIALIENESLFRRAPVPSCLSAYSLTAETMFMSDIPSKNTVTGAPNREYRAGDPMFLRMACKRSCRELLLAFRIFVPFSVSSVILTLSVLHGSTSARSWDEYIIWRRSELAALDMNRRTSPLPSSCSSVAGLSSSMTLRPRCCASMVDTSRKNAIHHRNPSLRSTTDVSVPVVLSLTRKVSLSLSIPSSNS